jgi:hypothetical protein
MTAGEVGSFIGSLLPTFLLSRLTLFLLKRWRGGYPRLISAHIGALTLCGLIGGWGLAGPAESFVFGKAVTLYALPQLIWFFADCWRERRGKPKVLAGVGAQFAKVEPSLIESATTETAVRTSEFSKAAQEVSPNSHDHSAPDQSARSLGDTKTSWLARTYFGRHWRGELSLPISYWINGFLATVGLVALALFLTNIVSTDDAFDPRVALAVLAAYWLSAFLVICWQLVGVWRSADRHPGRGGSKIWAGLAKLMVVLGVLRAIGTFSSQGVPQISEYTDIVFRGDPTFAQHRIRVLRDGTELEFAGGISFGVTQQLRSALDANPNVKVMHLNSNGGRVLEARRMRDLIRQRGLITVTSLECVSACTLAFLGGNERYLAPGARLGFHDESFPGATPDQINSFAQEDRQFMLSLGIPSDFIEHAFVTSSSAMWYPTIEELKAANVITGESSDFAITGINDEAAVDAILSISFYANLKEADPVEYRTFRAKLLEAVRGGLSGTEATTLIASQVTTLFGKYLPQASDALAIETGNNLAVELSTLGQEDPEACYVWMFPNKGPPGFNISKFLSKEYLQRTNDLLARLVADGATRRAPTPPLSEVNASLDDVIRQLRAKDGAQVAVLTQMDSPTVNHSLVCKVSTDLYQAVLTLPKAQAGPLLRYMFSGQ